MNRFRDCLIVILLCIPTVQSVCAAASSESTGDLDARMRMLSNELRCLVCQNQTLQDSNAPLAVDLRREIRGMMMSGSSDGDIVDYLVDRYGDFVLYRPPLKGATALLWFGPLILASLSVVFFIVALKRRNTSCELPDLDEATNKEDMSC